MTFTGNENHGITLSQAAAMTKNYRDTISTGQIIAHYFGGEAIQTIIDQSGCVGIRIYYGLNDEGVKQLIICGVNADGNDLYEGSLAERSLTCPLDCSSANPLNTTITS
jgi:hypothetical protein